MRQPLSVSVIVATRDRPALLRQALESLEGQTRPDFEVLVVDDGSQSPEEVAAALPRDSRFRVIRLEQSKGPGGARNFGIREARGEFVAILDDDDLAVAERLEVQVSLLRREPKLGLTFSPVQWFRANQEPTGVFPGAAASGRWPEDPKDVFRLLYLESNKIPNTTVMFRRELLPRFRYPEWTRVGEDWFLFLQMAASGVRMRAVRECLVWQRRDAHTRSLVQDLAYRQESELEVLRQIRRWLEDSGIREFDSLHKRAESNAYARLARMVSRWRGLRLAITGIGKDPLNGRTWHAAGEILWRARRHLGKGAGPKERAGRAGLAG